MSIEEQVQHQRGCRQHREVSSEKVKDFPTTTLEGSEAQPQIWSEQAKEVEDIQRIGHPALFAFANEKEGL